MIIQLLLYYIIIIIPRGGIEGVLSRSCFSTIAQLYTHYTYCITAVHIEMLQYPEIDVHYSGPPLKDHT